MAYRSQCKKKVKYRISLTGLYYVKSNSLEGCLLGCGPILTALRAGFTSAVDRLTGAVLVYLRGLFGQLWEFDLFLWLSEAV